MSISEKIADDMKKAIKSGDSDTLSILRMIKSAIKNMEIEKRSSLTDEDALAVLMTFAKRSKESIEQFSKAGRQDLVEKEEKELAVIREYLPKQLDEEAVRKIIHEVIDDERPTGPKDLGKVMKSAMARLKGQADGKLISKIVKERLEA